ncbi:MAG: M48 family metallopeptidase [Pseudomonadota bacterium]
MSGSDETWPGVYFDGARPVAQNVFVRFGLKGLHFTDTDGADHVWSYRRVAIEKLDNECRLTCRSHGDAVLNLSHEAAESLAVFPAFEQARLMGQRRFTVMVSVLTAVAFGLLALVFVGAPRAAGWLAHRTPPELEQQIGENMASQAKLIFRPCDNQRADDILEPAVALFAESAELSSPVTLTLVKTDLPNAFALPGGQTMATRGLLDVLEDDQEAFWAVVAHELAHVKNRDSLEAVFRNLGISTLLEVLTGGSGLAQQAMLLGGQLTELSYSRQQERRADDLAYDILEDRGLDPAALGRGLAALTEAAESDHDSFDIPEWMSTHPATDERVERAERRAQSPTSSLPLTDDEWKEVVSACDES